jgi:hypothetical protein
LTMGIGQKSPVQSICLSGLKTLDSCAIRRYRTPGLAAPSRTEARAASEIFLPGARDPAILKGMIDGRALHRPERAN